jgi:hypothetical protein
MYKIFSIEELNLEKINYLGAKKIETSESKYIFIPMVYKDSNTLPLLFQLPSIKLNDTYKKDNLLLPINTLRGTRTNLLKNFLNNLDEKIINDFKTQGKKWCKEMVSSLKNIEYKALVNDIDDDEPVYDNGVISLSLEDINKSLFNKNTESSIKIYNEKKELINNKKYEDILQKGNIIQCIIELKGLIITISENNNEICPYIKTHQIRYIEEKLFDVNLEDYSFLESEMEPQQIHQSKQVQQVIQPVKSMLQKLEESIVEYDDESSEDNEELNLDESSDSDDNEFIRKIAHNNDTSSEEMPKKVNKKFFNKKF